MSRSFALCGARCVPFAPAARGLRRRENAVDSWAVAGSGGRRRNTFMNRRHFLIGSAAGAAAVAASGIEGLAQAGPATAGPGRGGFGRGGRANVPAEKL